MQSAYSLESNGVAERYNRTLLLKFRAVSLESGLSPKFWGDTASYASYVTIVTQVRAIDRQTPFEMSLGRAPNVSSLWVFGCSGHISLSAE